jgi:multidrug efflux pump subunit AcrA (membrane-fusion protein)
MRKFVLYIVILFLVTGLYAITQTAKMAALRESRIFTYVEPGQFVKKGQLLFHMDIKPLKLQVVADKSNIEYTTEEFKRASKLIKTHSISLADYQAAETNYLNALKAIKKTEDAIRVSYCYAPFAGVVSKISNYTWSAVDDGDEVLQITAQR